MRAPVRISFNRFRHPSPFYTHAYTLLSLSLQTPTHYCLIEELGDGGNLSAFVKRRPRTLDQRRARSFCQQLVAAVAHMHERGVIHR